MNRNVIWIDENENDLEEVSLARAHEEGLLHRISVVYLTDDKGQILVQKRDDGRLDHSAAGHVDVGESDLEAAKRELEEELGVIGVELKNIGSTHAQDIGTTFNSRHMFRVYVCGAVPVKLKEDEVKSVFWANPKKVYDDMQVSPEKYTGGFKSTIELYLSQMG